MPDCAKACGVVERAPGRHVSAIAAEATRVKRENVIELNLSTETGVSVLPGRQIPVRLLGPASAVCLVMKNATEELFRRRGSRDGAEVTRLGGFGEELLDVGDALGEAVGGQRFEEDAAIALALDSRVEEH